MKKQLLLIALVVLMFTASLRAQPASAPSTAPTTAPRHQVVIPPGFIKVEASDRIALCESADKEWITKALSELHPSARPTTMPSDLADALSRKRDDILKQMSKDLGLADTSAAAKLFNEQVMPDLNKMADLRPPMYYLVCSKAKLLDLVHNGWSDPRFHYNRAADDVAVYSDVGLSIEHEMDDLLIPALYDPTAAQEKRIDTLQKQVDQNEANIAASLSMQGMIMAQTGLVAAIDESVVKPLALKPGQAWLGIGIEGLYSTRYMTQLNGMRNEDLLRVLTDDDPRNPIRASTINLMKPLSANDLRPEYAPAYVDALRRRSVIVVNDLLQRTKPDALPKLLAAIKQQQPKDADALVDLIKQTSGVDVSRDVLPQ
jgi:hypothetical protein